MCVTIKYNRLFFLPITSFINISKRPTHSFFIGPHCQPKYTWSFHFYVSLYLDIPFCSVGFPKVTLLLYLLYHCLRMNWYIILLLLQEYLDFSCFYPSKYILKSTFQLKQNKIIGKSLQFLVKFEFLWQILLLLYSWLLQYTVRDTKLQGKGLIAPVKVKWLLQPRW